MRVGNGRAGLGSERGKGRVCEVEVRGWGLGRREKEKNRERERKKEGKGKILNYKFIPLNIKYKSTFYIISN